MAEKTCLLKCLLTMDHRGFMNGDVSFGVQLPERIHAPVGFAGVLEDHRDVIAQNDSPISGLWQIRPNALQQPRSTTRLAVSSRWSMGIFVLSTATQLP